MFDFPPDIPWLYAWLGAAALLGIVIGWLLGRIGKARYRGERDRLGIDLDEALEARRLAEEAMTESGALSGDLQRRLDETMTSLGDADREIEGLRSDVDAAETRIAQLEMEQRSGQDAVHEAELVAARLHEVQKETGDLRAALSAAAVDADARVAAAESEAHEALGRVAVVEDMLSTADQEIAALRSRIEASASATGASESRDGLLSELREELESAREESASASRRLSEAEAALEEALSQLGEVRDELEAARSQADAEGSAGDALAARDHVVGELQARVAGLTGIEDRLKAREAELGELRRSQVAVMAARDAEIRSLRERLEAAERRQAGQPAGTDTTVAAALEAAQTELAAVRERSRHWEQEAAALRAGIAADPAPSVSAAPASHPAPGPTDLDARLDRMQELLSDKETRIAYLADRVARLESNLGTIRRPATPEVPVVSIAPPETEPAATAQPDDLTAIWGIGPAIQRKLNRVGITTFEHIAVLAPTDQARLGDMLGEFLDRFEADDWVGQARRLIEARGGTVPAAPLAPIRLTPPAAATSDDLTEIKGIGPFIEATLNGLGVNTFAQIAAWTEQDVERFGEALVIFQGRIARENWVEQARGLMRRR